MPLIPKVPECFHIRPVDSTSSEWVQTLVVLSLSNHADPYFLAWRSPTAQVKGLFQDWKELKMN